MAPPDSLTWIRTAGDDPLLDLCMEECLLEGASGREPALLTYSWPRPVLVLGYGQDPHEGIDLALCQREGIPVLRRCTGGTGVLHRGDLSAALVLPPGHPWTGGLRDLYGRFLKIFRSGIEAVGFPTERSLTAKTEGPRSAVCFEDHLLESLLFGGRKVLGCAQARRAGAVLIHGTLLLGENMELASGVFKAPEARLRRAVGFLPAKPGGAGRLTGLVAAGFGGALGLPLAKRHPSPEVREGAMSLRESRLGDPRWVIVPGGTG